MDFDDALAATSTRKGPRCTLCRFLDTLPDEQAAKINTALRSDVQQSHIARALAKMTGDSTWNSRGQMVALHRREH